MFVTYKEILKAFNSMNGCSVKVQHDYTFANRECLTRLHELVKQKLVAKVTVRGTRIMFKLEGSESWRVVKNPYAKHAADMTINPAE